MFFQRAKLVGWTIFRFPINICRMWSHEDLDQNFSTARRLCTSHCKKISTPYLDLWKNSLKEVSGRSLIVVDWGFELRFLDWWDLRNWRWAYVDTHNENGEQFTNFFYISQQTWSEDERNIGWYICHKWKDNRAYLYCPWDNFRVMKKCSV